MTLHFGLAFDDQVIPLPEYNHGGIHFLGPQGLLHFLESHLGLSGHSNDNDYLRIEQYRQALIRYLITKPNAFFSQSFESDQFATATELLKRRDELLLAGWNFVTISTIPPRLKAFSQIEALINEEIEDYPLLVLDPGFSDRFTAVMKNLKNRSLPVQTIYLYEPIEQLPSHFKNLFQFFINQKVKTHFSSSPLTEKNTDLANFQRSLSGHPIQNKFVAQKDGSLWILKGQRETDLAAFIAKILRLNPAFRPFCLIPHKNRALDQAIIQEGLPSMGIASASHARPTLQVLKLITVFLWNPIDLFKIMEFVSLPIKPLHDGLANQIAALIAKIPGINSERWNITTKRFFEDLAIKAQQDNSLDVNEIRRQFNFWFERKRYDIHKEVPKEEVISIFEYLQSWAYITYEESGSLNNSLLVLNEQAKQVKELLEALPETHLNNLELERIVRTIYEPAAVEFLPKEVGHLSYTHQSHGVIGPVKDFIWWNFIQNERDYFFSSWYTEERLYLEESGIYLESPATENQRLIWQRNRPAIFTQDRMLLVIPEMIDGKFVHAHPLWSDLEATFSNLEEIIFQVDSPTTSGLGDFLRLPNQHQIPTTQFGRPRPMIHIRAREKLESLAYETPSSLEKLLYYPYQWFFQYQIQLQSSSILSIVKDQTLMGNLSHRFFEKLLSENINQFTKTQLEDWIEEEAKRLLPREGAVLLLYGREPERVNFIQRIKYAAWSLISFIQKNGWTVLETEKSIEGTFSDTPILGRADLVLQRGEELAVVDLKWRGASYRERLIRNEEDLQLVLYSKLLAKESEWVHSAYFIMENGKLIARNNHAFKEVIAVSPTANHLEINQRIWDRMEKTFQWRKHQIQNGQIEIRCEQTQQELEDIYAEELLELLEMKSSDAPFDDFSTLINLID